MGVITKQIRKRGNQRLAEPLCTVSTLSISEMIKTVRRICEEHNQKEGARLAQRRNQGNRLMRWAASGEVERSLQYHIMIRDHDVLVSYRRTPQYILANQRSTDRYWLAAITFPSSPEPLPEGQQLVELRLAKWVINGDGKIHNQHKYEELSNELWEAVNVH